MKIAQFIMTTDAGGAETLILSLSQQLIEYGHQVEIHAFDNSWTANQCSHLNIPLVPLGNDFRRLKNIKKIGLWGIKHGQLLRKQKIDVLHSHCYNATLRGAISSIFGMTRHIATQHDVHSISEKTHSRIRWLNITGVLGTGIVMISNQMMKFYVERGMKEKYCCFIYNGVNHTKFMYDLEKRNMIRQQLQITDNDLVFISPGRLEHIKGFDVLIKAFNRIHDASFKLLILGEGQERDKLEQMVEQNSLTNKIKFIGLVNNVKDYLSAADVFVLASRSEGLPCSIIEAMFTKLPIVATDVGGNSELIANDYNGYLVPPENELELANTLKMVMSDKSKLLSMGEGSFTHSKDFSLETMATKYVSWYNGVCQTSF